MTEYLHEGVRCRDCEEYKPTDIYVGVCKAKDIRGIFAVKGAWGYCNLPTIEYKHIRELVNDVVD